MLLPDDLIMKKNCSKDMIKLHKKYKASVMASMTVKKNNVNRWGIYSISKKLNKQNFVISNVVEKPNTKEAPSNNAVIGRYILSKNIIKILKRQTKKPKMTSAEELVHLSNKTSLNGFMQNPPTRAGYKETLI